MFALATTAPASQRTDAASRRAGTVPCSREGRPIKPEQRRFFESRFGHDFSRVRVHSDPDAVAAARSINAVAYTAGDAIVVGHAAVDRRLLAHELTHVVQQRGATGVNPDHISTPDDVEEREADRVAAMVTDGASVDVKPSRTRGIFRAVLGHAPAPVEDEVTGEASRRLNEARTLLNDPNLPAEERARLSQQIAEGERALQAYRRSGGGGVPVTVATATSAGGPLALLAVAFFAIAGWLLSQPRNNASAEALRRSVTALGQTIERLRRGVSRPPIPLAPPTEVPAPVPPAPRPEPHPGTEAEPASVPRPTPPQAQPAPVSPPAPEAARPRTEPARPPSPSPQQQPQPRPQPRPRPRPPYPVGPDIDPDDFERNGCRGHATAQLGGNACHDEYAAYITGQRRDWTVVTPEGQSAAFDGITRDLRVVEVKYGFGWFFDPGWASVRRLKEREWEIQGNNQYYVANRCGLRLDWIFSDRSVRDVADGLVLAPCVHIPYRCRVPENRPGTNGSTSGSGQPSRR